MISIVSSVLVFILIISSFVVFGSPMTVRKQQMDDRRVSDLQSIQWQLINYWQQKGALPTDLALIEDAISGFYLPVDPETGAVYTYEKTGKLSFKLCGDFALSSQTDTMGGRVFESARPVFGPNEGWRHEAGTTAL